MGSASEKTVLRVTANLWMTTVGVLAVRAASATLAELVAVALDAPLALTVTVMAKEPSSP